MTHVWQQNFDPLGSPALSTVAAALPVCTLFYLLAVRRTPAWKAAAYGFLMGIGVALLVFHMPVQMAAGAVTDGLVFGWWRMAWILVGAVFVYDISVESRQFDIIKQSIGGISADRRLQLLLIAFAFGAFLEGAGGGGAPVAVTGAMLVGLGFPPFETALICLIANSAPVAFGGLGNPVRTLVAVTGLAEADFSAMIGRILVIIILILPFWLMFVFCKTREVLAVWPALVVAGVCSATLQYFWSNYIDASLVNIVAGLGTLLLLAVFLGKLWHPREIWGFKNEPAAPSVAAAEKPGVGRVFLAWSPFLILSAMVVLWGAPPVLKILDKTSWKPPVPGLHGMVMRMPPVTAKPAAEPAIFDFSWLTSPGTAAFFAGLISGPLLGLSLRRTLQVFVESLWRIRQSLAAILCMLALGYLTRYGGMDATLGMAMSHTGVLFPFFGTLIGWLGVALSGSDAGSNALFGSFQAITANRLGLSPILMGAANSAGGVMGKMIAAQSLVIAAAVTGEAGKEGILFRKVLKHSLGLAVLVGLLVLMYAYIFPGAIPKGHHYW
ncbi:MAG TPA: lactate permease LctP family transporter [Verrucomicrobiae bacterium]|nr:lactate permease LctP family transporter [Verrucomicrobiae bacterium]